MQTMTGAVLRFIVSAAVIIVAGTLLTRFGDTIAGQTRLGRLLVGAILVAAATSLPEAAVDIHAVRLGNPDLAVGDLMGSSLINLLILALADLLHRSPHGAFSRAAAKHALSASLSILLTALAGMAILARGMGLAVGGVGLGPLLITGAYLFGIRLVYRDQRCGAASEPSGADDRREGDSDGRRSLPGAIAGFLACAATILVAAPHLARSADTIAEATGLGGTFVGTTLVALSTSLPELVATLSALRLGAFDMAVGNLLGSNGFNMMILLPLELAHGGLLLEAVSPVHAFTALAAITASTVVVMGQLYRVESRRLFIEPDALLVITLVLGTLVAVYFLGATAPAG
jgi:cation:H+ antiporter